MKRLKNWQVPVFITFLLLGLLLTVQFRTQQSYLSDLSQQKTEDLVTMLNKLYEKKNSLEREIFTLDEQQRSFSADVFAGEALTRDLRQELLRQQMALGLVPVKGPGITVTFEATPPIVYLDIIDVINELWASQAEAIAINDIRVTTWTKIYWNKQNLALTVDGQIVPFPCTIKAIGDPEQLESGLRLLGGVLDDLAIYDIHPVVRKAEMLELPAADRPEIKYLKAKESQ
ncbi:hypothetical protein Tph_c19790 [Thermacetogenium phaeum DSM 12270]|uniref:Division initiation protein n=1 Tax=Thermacetogenium phaeum (strain ATCC BAA-254 / DSM 26808 / PB) TaxID=1089553 RepID=K4LH08_THEPS|nr:DUF881 domain-containing protein [Thermacetogenium phaeum]AFV12173.1 hypothetical protein Tph_c19790 [Thermacetogenium phaeum DSM 12270]